MRTFRIYFLSNVQVCNPLLLTIVTYCPVTYLLYDWKFVPFDDLTYRWNLKNNSLVDTETIHFWFLCSHRDIHICKSCAEETSCMEFGSTNA